MTIDNLLSGLIGGLVVGVFGVAGVFLLVRADDRRWRRENKGSARLLYYEVLHNLQWLKPFVQYPEGVVNNALSRSVWDTQQVRVASLLTGDDLSAIATAYFNTSVVLATREWKDFAEWSEWVKQEEARQQIVAARDGFMVAKAILSPWAMSEARRVPKWLRRK